MSPRIERRNGATRRNGLWLVSVLVCLGTGGVSWAAPPVLEAIEPRGAQRGRTVTVALTGRYLRPDARIITTLPARIERVERPADADDLRKRLPFTVVLDADMPVGVYPIRILTADGLSNVLRFSVSGLPEAREKEPNESADQAQAVKLPIVINGTLTAADQDYYRFNGQAGDRLVFEVEARRLGSGVDPALRILDDRGHDLAGNDDTPGLGADSRIDFVLPRTGAYILIVHDATFSKPSPSFYRLKMGAYAFAEAIFPLGWRRGGAVNVSLVGGNVRSESGEQASLILPAVGRWTEVGLNGGTVAGSLPFRFVLSDWPETIEPDGQEDRRLVPGTVVNGRLAKPREVDRYRMAVQPGQRWTFELDAATLGSSMLDAVLTVYGPNDKPLASADDGSGLDPRLNFDVPDDVHEVVVAVEDLHRRGGVAFGYRLRVKPRGQGVTLRVDAPFVNIARGDRSVVKVTANRNGYNGPIQLTIPSDLAGITAEGGLIRAGRQDGFLILSAGDHAPLGPFELSIVGLVGPAAKPSRCRVGGAYEAVFPSGEGLPAAVCRKKPMALTAAGKTLRVVQGFDNKLKITVKRDEAAQGEIEISGNTLPPGVQGGKWKIKEEATEVEITLKASSTSRVGRAPWLLTATTTVDDEPVKVTLPPLTIEVVRPFSVEVVVPPGTVAPGDETKLIGLVRREAEFDEVVRVRATDLPAGVTASEVTVAADQAVFEMPLTIAGDVKPGDVKITLKASAKMTGRKNTREYELPDVVTQLTVQAPKKDDAAAEAKAE